MKLNNYKVYVLAISFIIMTVVAYSQQLPHSAHSYLRAGNKEYSKLSYTHAEENYRKGLVDAESSFKLNYNLANSLYEQQRVEEAEVYYKKAIESARSDEELAKAYHNLGNTYILMKKFGEAVDSYKSSLRIKPRDLETKENLFWAQNMKKKEEQEKQEQKQENKDCNNKEKSDEGKEGEQKDQQNKNEQDEDKKEDSSKDKKKDEEQKEEGKKDDEQNSEETGDEEQKNKDRNSQGEEDQMQEKKLSKEDVLRLLKVQEGDEQKIREKLFKSRGAKPKSGKDW